MALCSKIAWLLLLFASNSIFAADGYPSENVKILYQPGKRAFIKNDFCFPVTVSVNNSDFSVPALSEIMINSDKWGHWKWIPGAIGHMGDKTVQSPMKGLIGVNSGPNTGDMHHNEFKYGYDFTMPEGTPIYAMEGGIVARIVKHFTVAHQDKARAHEVNEVEVVHLDGTVASYVHLKPGSVNLKHCEKVGTGQLIGESGHNGYSSQPHLHVDILRPVGNKLFQTVPLSFQSK